MVAVAFFDVTFDEDFDFGAFVVDVLGRKRSTGVDPWTDHEPVDALVRAHAALAGTELTRPLRAAIRAALGSGELDVRAQALAFLLGSESSPPDVEERAAVIDVARREVLAGRGMKLIRRVVADDPAWGVESAQAIVRADPLVFPALLLALKKHGGDVLGVIEALAPLGLVSNTQFVDAIESHVLDPESWRRIRRSMPNEEPGSREMLALREDRGGPEIRGRGNA